MIDKFNDKFEIFKGYKEKIIGVANGLEILSKLNERSSKMQTSNEVFYYNFLEKKIKGCYLVDLNLELQSIYNSKINIEILSNNRLYWVFCDLYDKLYEKRGYPYYKGIFTKYDIINKFIQGLRKNKKPNSLKFEFSEIMKNFNFMYFEEKISPQEFYLFMLDFITTMQITDVITFNQNDYSIEFNVSLESDLNILVYTSYNLMVLGENGIYNSFNSIDHIPNMIGLESLYNSCGQETKLFIDSLATSLVISSSVEKICAEENINNIFLESIVKTL